MPYNVDNPEVSNPNILHNPTGHQVLGAGVAILPFSLLSIGLRFWARWYQRVDVHIDDWLSLPALAGNIVIASLTIWTYDNHALGFATPQAPPGQDSETFSSPEFVNGKRVIWGVQVCQTVSLTFTKLCCLYFYRRVFWTGQKDWFYWATLGLIIFSCVWAVAFFFGFMFDCGSSIQWWFTNIHNIQQHCGTMLNLEMAFSITDSLIDLAILLLPFIALYKIRLSPGRKLAIAAIFFIGAFAITAAFIRMGIEIYAVQELLKTYFQANHTNTGLVSSYMFWTCVESSATITAASLPAIYYAAKDVVRRLTGRETKRRPSYVAHTADKSGAILSHRSKLSTSNKKWNFDTLSGSDDAASQEIRLAPVSHDHREGSNHDVDVWVDNNASANEAHNWVDVEGLANGQIRVDRTIVQSEDKREVVGEAR